MKIPVHLDMETGDPDDVMTLAVLATHPRADLRSVTLFPGGRDQVALVRKVLGKLGRTDVVIGMGVPKKTGVTYVAHGFYDRWFGKLGEADPDDTALNVLSKFKGGVLITGAPLTNIHRAFVAGLLRNVTSWTCQGGFVGASLMGDKVLPKFAGKETCPTWNFGGDRTAATDLLRGFPRCRIPVWMVPKSVCHGVIFDCNEHAHARRRAHAGLDLMLEGMSVYIGLKAHGKPLHDLLAAMLALDPTIGTWTPVTPFTERGEWGCRPEGPVSALLSIDKERFLTSLSD